MFVKKFTKLLFPFAFAAVVFSAGWGGSEKQKNYTLFTNMPDGQYSLGGLDVTVNGKLAALEDGTIAGSATNLMDCLRTAVSFGIPLHHAVRAASFNPAVALHMQHRIGSIAPGMDGTVVLLEKRDLSIRAVVFRGDLVSAG